jgi:hypothetical protein
VEIPWKLFGAFLSPREDAPVSKSIFCKEGAIRMIGNQ